MDTPKEDKVEIFSVSGDTEKSWSIDRYHLTVGLSIVSVVVVVGGLIWLASGGGGAGTSAASVLPTGELKFTNDTKKSQNAASTTTSVDDLPYPEVRAAQPLAKEKSTVAKPSSSAKALTPTPTTGSESKKSDPTATPTPTATPVPATPTASETFQATELKIEDIKVGEGTAVKSGDTIRIHYIGTLTNGTKFDSSYDRGTSFETQIGVGQVIEGWDKGVVGMKPGGKRKLTIPADMAYGATAKPNIPANSTLIFEMELVEIK